MKRFHKATGIFLIAYHVILLLVLPFYFYQYTPSLSVLLVSTSVLMLTGLSITAGYHRLWAHQCYRAHPAVEAVLLFFGTMSTQGSAIRWAFNHRRHHAHVDTDRDPHNIREGFWHAHCLWLLWEQEPIDPKVVSDLMRKPLLRFQDKYYNLLMVASNALTFLVVGALCGEYVSAFVLTWWLRLFLSHHFTWLINSLTHTWGTRPYDTKQTAVDNFFTSLLTHGEGYHNYHHSFPSDYRNGVRWYQYDPTKWLIWSLYKLGLASHLRRVSDKRIQQRKVSELRDELLARLSDSLVEGREALELKVNRMSQELGKHISEFSELLDHWQEMRCSKGTSKEALKAMKAELKEFKKRLKTEWKSWKQLSHQVMKLQPA